MPRLEDGVGPLLGLPLPQDFDMDVFLVTSGQRALGKLEDLLASEVETVQGQLERLGLRTMVMPSTRLRGHDIYFCREAGLLPEVRELENTQRRRQIGDVRADASRRLGLLHGYPACCVEAFISADTQRDADVLLRLAGNPAVSRSPLMNFFLRNISPIGFGPCRLDCPVALDRSREILRTLEAVHGVPVDAVMDALRGVILWFHMSHWLLFRGVSQLDQSGFEFEQVFASTDVSRRPNVPAFVRADRQVQAAATAMRPGNRVHVHPQGIDVLGPQGPVMHWGASSLSTHFISFTENGDTNAPALGLVNGATVSERQAAPRRAAGSVAGGVGRPRGEAAPRETGDADGAPPKRLSLAFVHPYGEPSDGFFPDTLLGMLCGDARAAGHTGSIVRVYYDGRDPAADEEVARRLTAWLTERGADLVVVDRMFDAAPIRAHVAAQPGRMCLLVSRGDSFDPVEGVDLVLGLATGSIRSRRTRRSPTIDELRAGFSSLLETLVAGGDATDVPGVSRVQGGTLVTRAPLLPTPERLPYRPALDQDVICLGEPPRVVRKVLFGNAGCPYSGDPAENPHYAGAGLDEDADHPMARLGCAFCCAGGDYQKRPDDEVVESLVEQARVLAAGVPDLEEVVLTDQHPLRFLERLVRRAAEAGVPPLRWLFAARADAFLRELRHVEAAVEAASEVGSCLELYLTGFESFSNRELARYNKGLTAETQLETIAAMRALALRHPGSFLYAGARGHSLILWNPWTTPEDLGETVAAVRRHGLLELFDGLGRNRLRMYADLPIARAAARDGALTDAWEAEEDGTGRLSGYNVEHPWRFLDPRTRLAWLLAQELRERIGAESEPAQLAAVIAFVNGRGVQGEGARGADSAVVSEIVRGIEALDGTLRRLGGERRPGDPPRGTQIRATPALFAGVCNNGCATCANRERWLPDSDAAVLASVDQARAGGAPVMLAGREPTMHPSFVEAVERARGDDGRPVGVVTNGRRFAYARFAALAANAGLTAASVKVFGARADVADNISRQEGGHQQALAGLRALRSAGVRCLELRAPLHRDTLGEAEALIAVALRTGVQQLRVEVAVDAVGLENLHRAADEIDYLASNCARLGLPLEVSSLRAGTRAFDWLPTVR